MLTSASWLCSATHSEMSAGQSSFPLLAFGAKPGSSDEREIVQNNGMLRGHMSWDSDLTF